MIVSFFTGILLVLIQFLAAFPWIFSLDPPFFTSLCRQALFWAALVFVVLVPGVLLGLLFVFMRDQEPLTVWGGVYASILQAQLFADLLVAIFLLLLWAWPKGGAVALAAFREGLRQPMFWLFVAAGLVLMIILPIIPYFTFGEDIKMVKQMGYDITMLAAVAFGVLAASMSISEEIEGRTAITLMSKPVSRRQFLLGKYLGLLLAATVMSALLSLAFDGIVVFKLWYGESGLKDPIPVPAGLDSNVQRWASVLGDSPAYFLRGIYWWGDHAGKIMPGVVLGFCQVMVLLAVAVALATRLPMVVNLVICLVVFFLGHLTEVLKNVSENRIRLVHFMAQVFDTILPGLDLFGLGPALAKDVQPSTGPLWVYVGTVSLYAVLYTLIVLLFGLFLFEDRDLA